MRKSVFQKAVSLLLCAVLAVGFLPGGHVHAEEAAGLSADRFRVSPASAPAPRFPPQERYRVGQGTKRIRTNSNRH